MPRRRYLSARDFTKYCSKLKLDLEPWNRELELYEKLGIFFPAARIVKPDDYVRLLRLAMHGVEVASTDWEKWKELDSLLFERASHESRDNLEGWHPFDQGFDNDNVFLSKPENDEFQPWKNYKCWITPPTGEKSLEDTVIHYYHAWQIHHLYAIKERYPLLAKYYWLLQNPSDEQKQRVTRLIPDRDDPITSFWGKARFFEALSFYRELYENEHYRAFENIPEIDRMQSLTEEQYEIYKENLENHAHAVESKFNLEIDELYGYLRELLGLHTKYETKEKNKLADDLEEDIIFLARLISSLTGDSFFETEDKLGNNSPYWTKRKFRHFDKATEVYDRMEEELERMLPTYNELFPCNQLTLSQTKQLSKFIDQNSLFILPYAFFDLHKTVNDPKRFRNVSLYIGMSNLTTGLESFLRTLAITANEKFSLNIETGTLHPLIGTMFPLGSDFQREQERFKTQNTDDGIEYLVDVFTDSGVENIVKTFLLVHGARNLISHHYSSKKELYGRLYAHLYDAVINSLLYSWSYALNEHWIVDEF